MSGKIQYGPRSATVVAGDHPLAAEWKTLFGMIEENKHKEAEELLQKLAKKSGNVEVELEGYQSLVAHAAAHSEFILRILLEEFHCDPNLTTTGMRGQSPLFAARRGCVSLLLRHGANPAALDDDGESALTHAIKGKYFDQAAEMVLGGVAPWLALDTRGQSGVHRAAAQQDVSESEQKPFWDAFFKASCPADLAATEELLRNPDDHGRTCIDLANAAGKEKLVKQMTGWAAGAPSGVVAEVSEASLEPQQESGQQPQQKQTADMEEANSGGQVEGQQEKAASPANAAGSAEPEEGYLAGSCPPSADAGKAITPGAGAGGENNDVAAGGGELQQKGMKGEEAAADAAAPGNPSEAHDSNETIAEDPKPLGIRDQQTQAENGVEKQHQQQLETDGADADVLEATTRPTLGDTACDTQRESSPSSAETSARGEESESALALANELKQLEAESVELQQKVQVAAQKLEEAQEANTKVVTRVASLFSSKPDHDMRRSQRQHQLALGQQDLDAPPQVTQESYETALLQTARLESQLTMLKDRLHNLLQRKEEQENQHAAKVIKCRRAFGEFVMQVAKNSFMRKGDKPVSEQQVKKLLQTEEDKLQRIYTLRRQLLLLQHQQELQIAQRPVSGHWKEERKPLQALDFEQLKMENQTLNERLVERQDEAQKLEAIARNSVQLLTHWREKLAFQEKRNAEAASNLAALDAELAKQREVAAQLKRERGECRQHNERIKCQTDVINSELLAADWESTQEQMRETEAEIAALRKRHATLTSFVANTVRQRDRRTTRLTLDASKLLMRHLKKLPVEEESTDGFVSSEDKSSCMNTDRQPILSSRS